MTDCGEVYDVVKLVVSEDKVGEDTSLDGSRKSPPPSFVYATERINGWDWGSAIPCSTSCWQTNPWLTPRKYAMLEIVRNE
jgi:hypothetical protein